MGKMTTAAAAAQVQRQSMQDSLLPHGRIQYPTWTQPEDFCLFSDNPHFGGAFDPMCILILEAPDPTLAADSSPNAPQAARSYTAYSFTRASHVTPKKMALPADLDLVGHSRMTGGDIHMCSITAFQKLVNARASTESPYLPIKGGKAYPRLHHHPNKQIDPPSLQEARILCSTHVDRSVRLWDIGSTLLTKSPRREDSQITRFYPDHLSTIELMPLLLATNILTASRVWQSTPELVYVTAVSPALEAGEIAVSLSSGECIVFRLSAESTESTSSAPASMPQSPHSFSNAPSRPSFEGAESINSSSSKGKGSFRNSVFKKTAGSLSKKTPKSEESSTFASNQDVSIHDLSGAPQAPPGVLAFRPAYCIARQRSVGSCCTSLTNMGFLGIAWEDGALTIVDLRGPDCIYHQTFKGERASRLSWTVAPLGDDLRILPRLLACLCVLRPPSPLIDLTRNGQLFGVNPTTNFELFSRHLDRYPRRLSGN